MHRRFALIASAVFLMASMGCSRRQTSDSAGGTASSAGKSVFDQQCANCHGAKGQMVPGWRATVQKMSLAQVEQSIRKGGRGMPAFSGTLSDEQIKAVAAYSKQLANSGG